MYNDDPAPPPHFQALMYALPNEALALVVALGINFLWSLFNGYGEYLEGGMLELSGLMMNMAGWR